jgi:hypothetical protein
MQGLECVRSLLGGGCEKRIIPYSRERRMMDADLDAIAEIFQEASASAIASRERERERDHHQLIVTDRV